MKKKEIIKSKDTFTDLIKKSNYFKTNDYVIYYKENNLQQKRFGFAISNKIGNAVTRNKLKRQTKEIVDKLKSMFKNNTDYIIMIRKGCLETTFNKRLISLKHKIEEINK